MNVEQWNVFEENEYLFRKSISSKKISYGDFICNGDIDLWIEYFKIINGIFFYKNDFLFLQSPNKY